MWLLQTLGVRGQLSRKELVTNAVEKLMSETRHVVESASSSAS